MLRTCWLNGASQLATKPSDSGVSSFKRKTQFKQWTTN